VTPVGHVRRYRPENGARARLPDYGAVDADQLCPNAAQLKLIVGRVVLAWVHPWWY